MVKLRSDVGRCLRVSERGMSRWRPRRLEEENGARTLAGELGPSWVGDALVWNRRIGPKLDGSRDNGSASSREERGRTRLCCRLSGWQRMDKTSAGGWRRGNQAGRGLCEGEPNGADQRWDLDRGRRGSERERGDEEDGWGDGGWYIVYRQCLYIVECSLPCPTSPVVAADNSVKERCCDRFVVGV